MEWKVNRIRMDKAQTPFEKNNETWALTLCEKEVNRKFNVSFQGRLTVNEHYWTYLVTSSWDEKFFFLNKQAKH